MNSKITLACNVPLAAAVNAKSPLYGWCSVTLSTLEGLSPGALALLAGASDLWNNAKDGLLLESRGRLDVTEATEEAVVVAIEARAALEAEQAEAKRVATERYAGMVVEAEALCALDPVRATDEDMARARVLHASLRSPEDGRVSAWRREVEATRACAALLACDAAALALDPASPEAESAQLADTNLAQQIHGPGGYRWPAAYVDAMDRRSRWLADRQAARAAREALAKAAQAAAILVYVRACAPEWVRAADDGRDVSVVGAKHAAHAVEISLEKAIVGAPPSSANQLIDGWTDIKPREVPTTRAYESLDALRITVGDALATLPAELRALCGEPSFEIVRLEVDGDECITAVLCRIEVAGRKVQVAQRAE